MLFPFLLNCINFSKSAKLTGSVLSFTPFHRFLGGADHGNSIPLPVLDRKCAQPPIILHFNKARPEILFENKITSYVTLVECNGLNK